MDRERTTRINEKPKPSFTLRLLIVYYGMLQGVHLVVLVFGLNVYIRSGAIGFPAPPPRAGWTEQAEAFLLGNGALDAIIAVAAILFVIGFFKQQAWNQALGLVCLTGSICSGGFFVIGTIVCGAWSAHPGNYFGLVLFFTPVVALFIMMFQSAWRSFPRSIEVF